MGSMLSHDKFSTAADRFEFRSRRRRTAMVGAVKKMYLFFAFCALQCWMVQGSIDLLFTSATCEESSPKYIKPGSCRLEVFENEDGETFLSTHLEITKELPEDVRVEGSVDGVGMDGETQYLGLHLEMELCELAQVENSIAIPLLRALNMLPEECPPQPGIYENTDYAINDGVGLPDTFPLGSYVCNLAFVDDDTVILRIQVYIQIY